MKRLGEQFLNREWLAVNEKLAFRKIYRVHQNHRTEKFRNMSTYV
jgi:hypothetical protein